MKQELDASVIVPSYNRRQALALTLASLRWQRHPAERFEVLVVDDGSTDGTAEWLASLSLPSHITVVRRVNGGRAAARNTGLSRCRGRIVIFCDADTIPDPGFVADHVAEHGPHDDRVVVGNMLNALTAWSPALAPYQLDELEGVSRHHADIQMKIDAARRGEAVEFIFPQEIEKQFSAVDRLILGNPLHSHRGIPASYGAHLAGFAIPWVLFVTQNASIPRALFDRVGGFDEDFRGWGYEDTEFGYRLHVAGGAFRIADRALTYHQSHSSELNERNMWRELAANYRRFFDKHPTLEVYLHWRFILTFLTAEQYSTIVTQHRNAEASPLKEDYLKVAHALALQFAELDDPSWDVVKRDHVLARID